ncbi:MAG TPA: hypothetical protein VK541_00240 [Pedobacter sp.]|uniref:UDP-GlcNAc--UDP-phosphate GlcNAc-1-phosphate transferase n=1 Tax=Pedobacter sp. TaxID=1411316 RepID=UPI002B9BB38D|nr:UDP-GlcNAc--UDP-phosphate GlcNAc-1-phosphate transferase [Pedobacter sp.]HMI00872.1 hypothetical protein [Pedobacter sp.]
MTSIYLYPLFLVLFFLIMLLYFKLADHYNIIDKPNHRSSHSVLTIRGGGVIFPIAAIIYSFLDHFQHPYFIIGLFLISFISFLDDLLTLDSKVRLFVHLISVAAMLYELRVDVMPFYIIAISAIFAIGVINAYNFMDGINGMTGAYSLVSMSTLYYINEYIIKFVASDLLILTGISILVFNYFNFRTVAKCFAGDVGSISIAFIIIFLTGGLILETQNYSYILFFLVYGLDAGSTIVFRLMRKENILEAHRSHFYQYLANERNVSHKLISSGYATIQLIINILLLRCSSISLTCFLIIMFTATILFMAIRFFTEGINRLLRTGI